MQPNRGVLPTVFVLPPTTCGDLQVLLKRRLAPTSSTENGDSKPRARKLVLGTLSAIVGHPINGYLPMPDWVAVQPDSSTREPPKEERRVLSGGPFTAYESKRGGNEEFYSGSSSPEYSSGSESEDSDGYDTSSSDEDGSGSSSESSEGSASGSDKEEDGDGSGPSGSSSASGDESDGSESSVGSRSRSSSEESSSYDSESSSPSSQGEEGVGLLIMGPGATSSGAGTYGASAPAPHSQDLTGLVERMSVADTDDNASPQPGSRTEGLNLKSLNMAGVQGPAAGLMGLGGGGGVGVGGGGSVRPGMAGPGALPPPTVLGRSGSSTLSQHSAVDPELDTSVSIPSTMLRHQTSSGLQVDYRYTRGRTDLISRPTTVLTLRLTLSNHRDTPIRRIRAVAPRDGTKMNTFPEVQVLGVGATVDVNLGIDFGGRAKEVSTYASCCAITAAFSILAEGSQA